MSASQPSRSKLRRGLSPTSQGVPEEPRVPLRLTVSRGALGIELFEPVLLGPLEVRALELILPNLPFPVDLSGGIPVFRHRRGDLERVEFRLALTALGEWIQPRVREILGGNPRRPQIWATPEGLGVGLVSGSAALAFDLVWAPEEGDARWIVVQPRSAGLSGCPAGAALRAVDSALGRWMERRGRVLRLNQAGLRLGQEILPALGARAPAAGRARFGLLECLGDELLVELDATFPPVALPPSVVQALEFAQLAEEGDQALTANQLDRARAAYLSALERAPRHPELVRSIAEIDVAVGGRADAALGMVVETLPAVHMGRVGAELLASVGDRDGASAALEECVRREPFAPLAGLLLIQLAGLQASAREGLYWLDQAVARCPGLEAARKARFEARLRHGDVEGALADAQHLEAATTGSRARHEACEQAAQAVLAAGFPREAGVLFERALRYLPDDPEATVGLGRALVGLGKTERALALFERAAGLSERAGHDDPEANLELALLLAREAQDLPAAIARVRRVPASSPRHIEARALEARWRAALGDVAGSSVAWARLREAMELASPAPTRFVDFLIEAAQFERDVEMDPLAAERHLGLALTLRPRDAELQRLYRDVAAVVAMRRRRAAEGWPAPPNDSSCDPGASPVTAPEAGPADTGPADTGPADTGPADTGPADTGPADTGPADTGPADTGPVDTGQPAASANAPPASEMAAEPSTSSPQESDAGAFLTPVSADEEVELEAQVQRMESAIRADPGNSDAAIKLARALERLGRDPELFALVSARMEDADEPERTELLPVVIRVLERLQQAAQVEGRSGDAGLYASLRSRFEATGA